MNRYFSVKFLIFFALVFMFPMAARADHTNHKYDLTAHNCFGVPERNGWHAFCLDMRKKMEGYATASAPICSSEKNKRLLDTCKMAVVGSEVAIEAYQKWFSTRSSWDSNALRSDIEGSAEKRQELKEVSHGFNVVMQNVSRGVLQEVVLAAIGENAGGALTAADELQGLAAKAQKAAADVSVHASLWNSNPCCTTTSLMQHVAETIAHMTEFRSKASGNVRRIAEEFNKVGGGVTVEEALKREAAIQGAAQVEISRGSALSLSLPFSDIGVPAMIGRIINALLGIVGALALAFFVYGGFTYMTAGGSEERVDRAKKTLVWSTLGLVAIFSAYAVITFLFSAIFGAKLPRAAVEGSDTGAGAICQRDCTICEVEDKSCAVDPSSGCVTCF